MRGLKLTEHRSEADLVAELYHALKLEEVESRLEVLIPCSHPRYRSGCMRADLVVIDSQKRVRALVEAKRPGKKFGPLTRQAVGYESVTKDCMVPVFYISTFEQIPSLVKQLKLYSGDTTDWRERT